MIHFQDVRNSEREDRNKEPVSGEEFYNDFDVDTVEETLVFEPKCTWDWFPP